jgi:DNA-directed RNA polymerase subunit F
MTNKRYTLVFLDAQDNELTRKEIDAFDFMEAFQHANDLQANSMLNDLSSIEIYEQHT